MKKIVFLFLLILGFTLSSVSQIDKMRDQLDDAGAEEQGMLTLRFLFFISFLQQFHIVLQPDLPMESGKSISLCY